MTSKQDVQPLNNNDVTIIDLKENPGLYPLKLGNAKVQESSWTLIKRLDCNLLLREFQILQNNVKTILTTFKSKPNDQITFYKGRLDNLHSTMESLVSENAKKLNHLFPEQRSKRGLADGLGSVFKFITGNLDAND